MTHPFLTMGCWILTAFNLVMVIAGIDAWHQHKASWYTGLSFVIGMLINSIFSYVAAESFANCKHQEEDDTETDDDDGF